MKTKLFLLILSIVLAGCGGSGRTVLLRLHYAVGDEISYVSQQKTIGSENVQISNETEVKFRADSVTGKDEAFTFNVKLVGIRSNSKMFDKDEQYDSRKRRLDMTPEERQTDELYIKALSTDYTFKVNNMGKVIDPFKDWKGDLTDSPIDMGLLQLEFPQQPVKVGYTWTQKRDPPLLHKLNTFTYTIDKITDDEVTILVSAILVLQPIAANAHGTGKYIINAKNGWLKTGYIEMPLVTGDGKALISVFVK